MSTSISCLTWRLVRSGPILMMVFLIGRLKQLFSKSIHFSTARYFQTSSIHRPVSSLLVVCLTRKGLLMCSEWIKQLSKQFFKNPRASS